MPTRPVPCWGADGDDPWSPGPQAAVPRHRARPCSWASRSSSARSCSPTPSGPPSTRCSPTPTGAPTSSSVRPARSPVASSANGRWSTRPSSAAWPPCPGWGDSAGRVSGYAQILGTDDEPLGTGDAPTAGQAWVDAAGLNPYELVEGTPPAGGRRRRAGPRQQGPGRPGGRRHRAHRRALGPAQLPHQRLRDDRRRRSGPRGHRGAVPSRRRPAAARRAGSLRQHRRGRRVRHRARGPAPSASATWWAPTSRCSPARRSRPRTGPRWPSGCSSSRPRCSCSPGCRCSWRRSSSTTRSPWWWPSGPASWPSSGRSVRAAARCSGRCC